MRVFLRGCWPGLAPAGEILFLLRQEKYPKEGGPYSAPAARVPGLRQSEREASETRFAQTTLASFSARPTTSRRFAKGLAHQRGGKTTISKLPTLKRKSKCLRINGKTITLVPLKSAFGAAIENSSLADKGASVV